ncbi:MAG: hypothetical protein ABIE84_03990, partial [bacterium]
HGRPVAEHLHIAVSYDAEMQMGYEYLIGVNPNSELADEIDLSGLWTKLAGLETAEAARTWGGHKHAGGSPFGAQTALEVERDILPTIGTLPTVVRVRQGVAMYRDHTLNLPEYLVPRIPAAALAGLDAGEFVTVELHHGPMERAQHYLGSMRSELEQLEEVTTKDGVKQNWYRKKGTNHFIVANILGETKLEHMRLYLTYAGLSVEKIYHHFTAKDYVASAKKLVADTAQANGGKFPARVVIGPSGTIGFITAFRLTAKHIAESLQKLGGKGKALVAKLRSALETICIAQIEKMAENLDYNKFCAANPRIPDANKRQAYEGRIKDALTLLAGFDITIEGLDQSTPGETLEARSSEIIKALTSLPAIAISRLFAQASQLGEALELSPEEVLVSAEHSQTLNTFQEQTQELLSKFKIKKCPFELGQKVKADKIKKRVDNSVYQAHLLSVEGKEPVLLVNIPFGNLAEHLGIALAEVEQLEHVMFMGNGGFITNGNPKQEAVEVGDLFVPVVMLTSEGSEAGFSNQALSILDTGISAIDMTGSRDQAGPAGHNVVLTRHAGYVVSPLEEHDGYVAGLHEREASSVELEMGPLFRGLGPKTSEIKVSKLGYFSDIPGKEGETLADASLGTNPRILAAKNVMVSYVLGNI